MIAIGSDHGGYTLKQTIIKYLEDNNIEYKDYGCHSEQSCDYPVYAKAVGNAVVEGLCDKGILICSTGIGISIAANKIAGIRAALCHDCLSAQITREHNNANVLVMGSKIIGDWLALKVVEEFFKAEFSNEERHIRRINQIENVNNQ